jgi:hypothetical protein
MTLKHTPPQVEALFNMYNSFILLGQPQDEGEMLIQVHMVAIYKKLRNVWEGKPRKVYSLTLTEPEALAYRIFWSDVDMTGLVYEWNFIKEHCAQIHRELQVLKGHKVHINKLLNQ